MRRLLLLALASLALPSFAAQTGHAVYRPGLTQARIPLGSEWGYRNASLFVPNLSSNLLGLVDEGHSDWIDRTLDVFKDGEHKKNGGLDSDPNPLSGISWPWLIQNEHGLFAYEGEMFVQEGTEYYFFGRMYTGEALVVDGTTVVWQGEGNSYNSAPEIYGSWIAPKTGWVPFNAWLWAWKSVSVGDPQWSQWGLQYNVDGFSLEGLGSETAQYSPPPDIQGIRYYSRNEYTNVWKRFVDPGNGTFLRTATTNRFTTATTTDGRTWNLTFEGVPHGAQLVAFWGPTDGVHDAEAWESHSTDPVDVPAGDSSTTVFVAPGANATALRFRLAYANVASTNGLDDVFEEWTEVFPVSDAPVVRIDAVRPGFTNVVVSGELAALGRDGADATVTIQIANAADESFADPISTNLPVASVAGPFEVLVQGIETNAAYLVRAIATATSCATSSVVSFRTARPTPAAASANVVFSKFFEADVAAVVSDWGAGATGAEVWIDVAPNDTFAPGETHTVSLGVLSGHLPKTAVGEVVGLDPDSDYRARIRIRNTWGLESESPSVSLRTSAVPLVFSEPEASSANGWASVSLSTNYAAAGTVYSVHLSASSQAFTQSRNWSVPSNEPPFEWSVPAASGQRVHFRFTISWTNGVLDSGDSPIIIEADTMWSSAADSVKTLEEIDILSCLETEIVNRCLRPGETVELIPSTNDVIIAWHTNAVVSIDEKGILTALEPGAVCLYEQDSSGQTNHVIGVIVLPSQDPEGGIYLHRTLNNFTWTNSEEWVMIAPGQKGYPDAPGALAYVVTPASYGYHNPYLWTIQIPERITLGGLVIGQLGWIHHHKGQWSLCYWYLSDSTETDGELVFNSGADDGVSWLRLAGHSFITSFVQINVPISLENDFEIDEMNRVQDEILLSSGDTNINSDRERGLYIHKPVDVGSHTLRIVRTHPYPYHYGSSGSGLESCGWISFRNDIRGSGTIRFEAATQIGLVGNNDEGRVKAFSGVWDIINGDLNPKINSNYGAASLNMSGSSLGNAKEMIIRGSWHRAEKTWPRGAFVRTGHPNSRIDKNYKNPTIWTNDWQDALPGKITLDGGYLQLYPQAKGVGRNCFRFDQFIVPVGPMGRLEAQIKNDSNWPHVLTEITNLVIDAGTVVSFDHNKATTSESNEFYIVNEPTGWIPDSNATSQFLPFFFSNNQQEGTGGNTIEQMSADPFDNTRLAFRDRETGKVSLGTPDETPDSIGNYRRWTAGETLANGNRYFSMQLAANVTNAFEEGATVQNLAGYLDMRKGAMLGRLGEDAGATLDFGDQPARIFNGNWGEIGTIGCRLAGTAGLVTGGNGTIALAASAEGVSGGVRVAGGTLELLSGTVRLANGENVAARGRVSGDIRVEAGSRLVVHGAACINPGARLFLNDRDWIPSVGHVQLLDPSRPVYVRELVVGGKTMPHGYYGSSASGAEHADDVHFEGPGVLYAGTLPTLMIFR